MTRRTTGAVARPAALVACLALVAACSTTVDGRPVDLPSGPPSSAGFPSSASPTPASTLTPTPTPTSVRTARPAAAGDRRVAVTSGKNVVFDRLGVLPTDLVAQLRSEGNGRVQILDRSTKRIKGRPALAFRVRYLPLGNVADPAIWFYTAIDDGSALIIVQTVDFPERGATATRLPRDQRLHQLVLRDLAPA